MRRHIQRLLIQRGPCQHPSYTSTHFYRPSFLPRYSTLTSTSSRLYTTAATTTATARQRRSLLADDNTQDEQTPASLFFTKLSQAGITLKPKILSKVNQKLHSNIDLPPTHSHEISSFEKGKVSVSTVFKIYTVIREILRESQQQSHLYGVEDEDRDYLYLPIATANVMKVLAEHPATRSMVEKVELEGRSVALDRDAVTPVGVRKRLLWKKETVYDAHPEVMNPLITMVQDMIDGGMLVEKKYSLEGVWEENKTPGYMETVEGMYLQEEKEGESRREKIEEKA